MKTYKSYKNVRRLYLLLYSLLVCEHFDFTYQCRFIIYSQLKRTKMYSYLLFSRHKQLASNSKTKLKQFVTMTQNKDIL